MSSEDNKALDELISDAMSVEKDLMVREEALAAHNKEFANWLKVKKHQDEQLEVLWDMVKEEMEARGLTAHEVPGVIKLTLSPSGKFRLEEGMAIEDIPDELCDIKKSISNKKVKAYIELNDKLPEGIESTGSVLRKKLL